MSDLAAMPSADLRVRPNYFGLQSLAKPDLCQSCYNWTSGFEFAEWSILHSKEAIAGAAVRYLSASVDLAKDWYYLIT